MTPILHGLTDIEDWHYMFITNTEASHIAISWTYSQHFIFNDLDLNHHINVLCTAVQPILTF